MKRSAVLLARFLGFISTAELDPYGNIPRQKLFTGIVQRFGFLKFPQKLEEFDDSKGIEFLDGTWNDMPVLRLTIYYNGLLIDTRTSTAESERVLEEALTWAANEFGIKYTQGSIMRKRYLSQVLITSDAPLLVPSKPVDCLASRINEKLQDIIGEPLVYKPTRLDLDFDRSMLQKPPVAFLTIQRAVGFSHSEGKYYSESPIPTEDHFAILEQYEADIKAAGF